MIKKFKSISDVRTHIESTDNKLPFPIVDNASDYESLLLPDGKMAIIPSLNKLNSIYVYRAQNKRYKKCTSTLLRGTVTDLDIFAHKIRMAEFENLLKNPRRRISERLGLKENIEALAQHYGLKTLHLDVTQDFNVAAFFACCKQGKDGNWLPMETGTGVLYRSPMTNLRYTDDIVGLQTYPRPKAQVAHSIKVDINENFEKMPLVETFEFEHNEEESNKLLKLFDSGRTLFPYDPIDEKAYLIQNNNNFAIKSLRRALKKDNFSAKETPKKIKEINKWFQDEHRGKFTIRNEYSFNKTEKRDINNSLEEFENTIIQSKGFRSAFFT